MKIIASTILAVVAALGFTAAPAAATGDLYSHVCVQDYDGKWFAYTIESQADVDWIADRRVESFPNSAVGCAAYGEQKSAPTIPQHGEPTCEPIVETVEIVVEKIVEKPVDVVRYVETTVVDTQRVDELTVLVSVQQSKIDRQRSKIAQLRAKLQRR